MDQTRWVAWPASSSEVAAATETVAAAASARLEEPSPPASCPRAASPNSPRTSMVATKPPASSRAMASLARSWAASPTCSAEESRTKGGVTLGIRMPAAARAVILAKPLQPHTSHLDTGRPPPVALLTSKPNPAPSNLSHHPLARQRQTTSQRMSSLATTSLILHLDRFLLRLLVALRHHPMAKVRIMVRIRNSKPTSPTGATMTPRHTAAGLLAVIRERTRMDRPNRTTKGRMVPGIEV